MSHGAIKLILYHYIVILIIDHSYAKGFATPLVAVLLHCMSYFPVLFLGIKHFGNVVDIVQYKRSYCSDI